MNRFLLLSTIGLTTFAASLAVAPRVQAEVTADIPGAASSEANPSSSVASAWTRGATARLAAKVVRPIVDNSKKRFIRDILTLENRTILILT